MRGRSARSAPAILLTRRVGGRELVVHRCLLSAAAGVAPGMDLAHARSLLPQGTNLHVEEDRPERDLAALRAVAAWAIRFAPAVAPDPPDGLLIDITGTERLYRGEGNLVRALVRAVCRLGLNARAAAAPTFACAWALARYGPGPLLRVPDGGQRRALEDLPVQALGIDERMAEALEELGVLTIGHVLAMPRSKLPARFDRSLVDRLDRALGLSPEVIDPIRPEPPARVEMHFDGPTTHWESVEAAVCRVVHDLGLLLLSRERGARQVDLDLLRSHAPPERLSVRLSRPSRNPRHLWSLLRPGLERADMGEGVEGVVITAPRTARLRHEQAVASSLDPDVAPGADEAIGELVDTLVARLGSERVVRMLPVESHLPERAFRAVPVMEEARRARTNVATVTPHDRPTLLLPRPEPAHVLALTPDGPVLSLRWRGEDRRVARCLGPERIGPEWWRWRTEGRGSSPPDRDYFAVQVEDGCWLWVCRQVDAGRWFVHGAWA